MSQKRLTVWHSLAGWVIENRVVVGVLSLLLIATGLYVAPFDLNTDLPRDPVPVDAIPDIGENQQIVFTEWAGRSPRDVEDQITYPLTTALLGIPGVQTARSASAFGFSTIYLIFDDSTEFYWSRARVLEKLSSLRPGTLPAGVSPTLGPDATALGQIFWYTLEGQDPEGNVVGGWDPDELRSIQDWTVRYALQAVSGVSEVASVGGFTREYQVDVDPDAMRAHGVTLTQVANAVRRSNLDIGARAMEINRVEYVIRGLGQVESLADLEATVIVAREHTPIRVRDVARVALGPGLRRGALDDEGAPAVGGVVVARFMENPLKVIEAVKERIKTLQPSLPRRVLEDGTVSQVTLVPFYDRTQLIGETLATLSTALYQQILVSILVVLIMLRSLRASLLISALLPLGVLVAFVLMKGTGVDANIMALGGIAIAIGTMVDIGIVFTENISQHLARTPDAARSLIVRDAVAEVAPAVLTSTLTTVVSFLPVLGLTASELRLFAPLALTKTYAMGGTLLIALAVLPGAALLLFRPAPTRRSGPFIRTLFRAEHLRDWVLVALSVVVLSFDVWAGLAVLALGIHRLVRPLLSDTVRRWWARLEIWIAVICVTLLLASNWSPLGPEQGAVRNVVFVGGLIALVMFAFWAFERVYGRLLAVILRHKLLFLSLPLALVVLGLCSWLGAGRVFGFLPDSVRLSAPMVKAAHAMPGLGREYMPPFDEGAFLYMPTTMPHASIGEVREMMSQMDAAIAAIPEVDRVVGKLGRVDSALDPAPVSMIETVVTYLPEYGTDADGNRVRQWRDHIRSPDDIWTEITRAAEYPGLTGAPPLMPIGARIVMLQSGMRAPMGIKIKGPNLASIDAFGQQLEGLLKTVPQLSAATVFADRVVGKPYLEIDLDREAIGRYGLAVEDVQQVLQIALGGRTLSRTVEGRERYPVRVRYMRETRDSFEALERILIPTPAGTPIPLAQVATLRYARGPQVIKAEDTFKTSYVLFDRVAEVSEVEAAEAVSATVAAALEAGTLKRPDGVTYELAGTYQNQLRSEQRLLVLIPVALALIFILLFLQFKRSSTTLIIFTGVVVAASGGFVLLWLYGRPGFMDFSLFGLSMRDLFRVDTIHLSVAVWIGFIALVGIATDDGVVMATYLKQRFGESPVDSVEAVRARTCDAGQRRIRPCLMTTATTLLALLPVVTATGRGADTMMPMALPIMGGMLIELMTLFVVPVLYCLVEERRLKRRDTRNQPSEVAPAG